MLSARDIYVLTRGWEGDGQSKLPPLDLDAWCALVLDGPEDSSDAREFFAQVRRVVRDTHPLIDRDTHPLIDHVVDYAHAQHDRFFAGDFSLDIAALDILRFAVQDYADRFARVVVDKQELLAALQASNKRNVTIDVRDGLVIDGHTSLCVSSLCHARSTALRSEAWEVTVPRGKLRAILRRYNYSSISLDYSLGKLIVDGTQKLEVIDVRKNSKRTTTSGRRRVRDRSAAQAE